ncbi:MULTISPECIES: phasin family protein [Pseudoxanthomonas]|uniref:phasin family protein n=1 Tax=Pseudoxanthomonas TaxID=83618 RepID=UPI001616B96F|nr:MULTISPECIES: phasin family protein [Pseudoxanthomonas]MBB3274537.1 poly(hydroxyalkanoate) granule-associated protein [Pseudoxanthomonas sp. OG2]MBV7475043.1 phasin family protein [Pseudoxanthomonas sp. PXM05]
MATLKKSARKKSASGAQQDNLQAQAQRLSKNLSESAQQVWLAGVGAFGRAQAEGSKLFETLVKEGLSLEQTTRKLAGGRVDAVRDAVESTVGQARERASDTWDRLEKVFEDRVQRALRRLEVPSREDLGALIDRVDALNAELRRLGGVPSARKPARKAAPAVKKAAATKKATAAKRATAGAKRTSAKRATKKNAD